MDCSVVDDIFDNVNGLSSTEAIDLIENFFKDELPQFHLKEKLFNHSAYFTLSYSYDDIEIELSSGRLRFEHSFKIDSKEFPLRQFDRRMDNVVVTSRKNLLFTLKVIKRFLEE